MVLAGAKPSSGLTVYVRKPIQPLPGKQPASVTETPAHTKTPSSITTQKTTAEDDDKLVWLDDRDDEAIPDYQRAIARPDGKEDEEYYRDVENLTAVYAGSSNCGCLIQFPHHALPA